MGQFLNYWIDNYAVHSTSPRTQQGYRGNIDRYILPSVGNIPLQSLRSHHIQEMETALMDRGLSANAVLHVHRILKQALSHAVMWEKLNRNPA